MPNPVALVICGANEAHSIIKACDLCAIGYQLSEYAQIYFIFFFEITEYEFMKVFIACRNIQCSTIP